MLKDKIQALPLSPGCYLFKDEKGKIIYVGKAKQLRKRVSSYFAKKHEDVKTQMLVAEIKELDFISTTTEVEALILENNLIKLHYPQFNIDLKDAQRYAYIRLVTDSPLPYIEVERSRHESGEYYGPFVSGFMRKLIVETINRTFKVLTRKPSPRTLKLVDREAYLKRVAQARKILRGEVNELIAELKKERESASKSTFYEYALSVNNRIDALESLKEKQYMELTRSFDAHIINYVNSGGTVYLLVFSIRKGILEGKQEFVLPYREDFLSEFILQYYDSAPIPHEVIVPHEVDEALAEYLSAKKKRKVEVIIPSQGDKKQLLELVLKNVHDTFFFGKGRLVALKEALGLPKLPTVMECFDISHMSGTNTVASMVSFKDGVPDKENYRKYKIRTINPNSDDYIAMKEVIERRYFKLKKEQLRFPDLIVIDGGKGQLSTAVAVLKNLNIKIPIISLAKQFEEVYLPAKSEPIRLPKDHKGLQLLQAIRDEAHRFAITYQQLLRGKELFAKYNGLKKTKVFEGKGSK
ncbi:MAG: excinuclease ABC subunit UvrC [Candidatus Pacearchaeota archaeon]